MVCQSFLLFFSPGVLVQLHKYEAVKMSDGPPFYLFQSWFWKKIYYIIIFDMRNCHYTKSSVNVIIIQSGIFGTDTEQLC